MADTRKVRGITIKLDADTTGFAKAMGLAATEVKRTTSALKDMENLLKNSVGEQRTELLTYKQIELERAIEQTKDKIKEEQNLLAEMNKDHIGEEITNEQLALERQIIADEQALESLEKQYKSFGSVSKQELLATMEHWKEIGGKISEVGENITNAGKQMSTYVTAPIVAAGTAAVKSSVDFETAMAKVQSVSLSATAEEMEALREEAINLSKDSKYSAAEAADALYYMGLAGWDASEMLRALPDVLNLAAAGDMDLGEASDIVTDYITAFGLSASDATDFVDIMAQTMANSNTTVEQMGEAFKYAAPVAGALGYSVEDVSFAIGLMANNGIKGTQAGTTLRMMMQRLANPTSAVAEAMDNLGISLTDDSGEMLSFREVLDQMRASFGEAQIDTTSFAQSLAEIDEAFEAGELSEEEYEQALVDFAGTAYGATGAEKAKNAAVIAGTRAMSGMLALINTTNNDYESLSNTINTAAGAARNIADVMLDTTAGSMTILRNNINALGIEIGDMLVPYLREGVDKVQDLVQWFSALDTESQEMIVTTAALAAGIGPLLIVVGSLTKAVGNITSGVGSLVTFAVGHPIATAVIALTTAVGGLIAISASHQEKMREEREAVNGLSEDQKALIERIGSLADEYASLQEYRDQAVSSINDEYAGYESLATRLDLITDSQGNVLEGYRTEAEYITGKLSEALGIEIKMHGNIIDNYNEMCEKIDELIRSKKREAIVSAYQEEYTKALQSSEQAQWDMVDAYNAAQENQILLNEAKDAYNEALAEEQERTEYSGQALSSYNLVVNDAKKKTYAAQQEVERLEEKQRQLNDAYDLATQTYGQYMTTITNYDGVMEAMATGDVAALDTAITHLTNNFKTSTTATKAELEEQVANFSEQYDAMKKALDEGMAGVTIEQVQAIGEMLIRSKNELAKANDMYEVTASGLPIAVADGINSTAGYVEIAVGHLIPALSMKDKGFGLGESFATGFADGIRDNTYKVTDASHDMATSAVTRGKKAILYGSPSRVMIEVGQMFSEGFAIGIADGAEDAARAAEAMSRRAVNAVNSSGMGLSGGSAPSSTTNNYGAINVTVNGADTSNAAEIANAVADIINREVRQRQVVYG